MRQKCDTAIEDTVVNWRIWMTGQRQPQRHKEGRMSTEGQKENKENTPHRQPEDSNSKTSEEKS